ncbi:3-hydroxyisobutyrate dehydrogenase [Pasteurellaceae bacterium Pebbles2]|nr:3-hydroxyisobutyrate dehydrogenase [Pasteurellaceae bacterium Pebbles2]
MDFSKILNQVLDVAQTTAKNTMNGNSTTDKVAKIGGGAAVIGALSMLFGRNGGSSLAKLGSLAALGSIAYQAYQKYQQNQTQTAGAVSEASFNEAVSPNASQVVLMAMIAAAEADGAISEEEQRAILAEVGDDVALQQWVQQAVANPATVDQIAQLVGNNQALAAQVYLAARMVCGAELARKEVIFLANLAEALSLEEAFVEQLEKQAGF